jgi:teichuronic acid biosynthesis glycosyltransferase TuaG
MHPLVSIIVPAKDVEMYIGDAIHSALSQTYDNWEMIIVANACVDNTVAKVQSFHDVRINLIVTDVGGLSNARNLAMGVATGEFICFLDADDKLPANSIKARVEFMMANDHVSFVDGVTEIYNKDFSHRLSTWAPSFKGVPYHEMMLLAPRCFCGITWMIRRSSDMELKFNADWSHLEDRIFYLSIANKGKYDFVQDVTYQIRRRPLSLMTNLKELESAYKKFMNYTHRMGVLNEIEKKAEKRKFHLLFCKTYLKNYSFIQGTLHGIKFLLGKD